MSTRIFSTTEDRANEKAAHAVWVTDQTQTVLVDGAGRYAVGHLGAMEEDIDHFMAPDDWEWLEVEQDFYDVSYWEREA